MEAEVMSVDKPILAKEFHHLSFNTISINKFVKLPDDLMDYQTIRSAFIFPIQGEAQITFDDEVFLAVPGKVIHGCPNKKVSFKVLGDEPFCHINLYYTDLPDLTFEYCYRYSTFEFSLENVAHTTALLEHLCGLYTIPQNKEQLKKDVLLQSFLNHLFFEDTYEDKQQIIVKRAIKFMEENYTQPLSLKDLADYTHKTPDQFSYIFYKHMGIRPIDYLIQLRLKKAITMLNQGCPVKRTAESVGYQDPYYFSRLFKKYLGMSPSQIGKTFPSYQL